MIDEVLDTVIHGDALEVLKTLPNECIDAIVADPPCGISFMSRNWDSDKGGRTQWVAWLSSIMSEAKRCLRPGGHCLVWSLPRTSHWTALALEDAGFEIRDCLYQLVSGDTLLLNFLNSLSEEQQHAFMQVLDAQREPSGILHINGSGFPKSLNVSVSIDKLLGKEREIVGKSARHVSGKPDQRTEGLNGSSTFSEPIGMGQYITKPATPESEAWNGWGSALKPACENWWLVRKPLAASSIAENVLQYGTGALNIDASRIQSGSIEHHEKPSSGSLGTNGIYGKTNELLNSKQVARLESGENPRYDKNGRFPSHLILTHTPSCIQVGTKRVQANGPAHKENETKAYSPFFDGLQINSTIAYRDEDGMETVTAWECPEFCPVRVLDAQGGLRKSGAIRPYADNSTSKIYGDGKGWHTEGGMKTSYHEPSEGGPSRYFQQLPALDDIPPYIYAGKASRRDRTADNTVINTHPTVKSLALSKYLVKLVTPKDGIVLDCFAGSGSILCAAIYEGFHFVGIEREEEYVEIARKRIQHAMSASGTQQPAMPLAPSVPTTVRKQHNTPHSSQLSLWDQEAQVS